MEHLRRLFSGVQVLIESIEPRGYPKYKGFAHDAQQLRGDWKAVGNDIRSSLKKEKKTRPKVSA
jgi:hypothetical protein